MESTNQQPTTARALFDTLVESKPFDQVKIRKIIDKATEIVQQQKQPAFLAGGDCGITLDWRDAYELQIQGFTVTNVKRPLSASIGGPSGKQQMVDDLQISFYFAPDVQK